jgi:hypothetical protein
MSAKSFDGIWRQTDGVVERSIKEMKFQIICRRMRFFEGLILRKGIY